LRAVLDPNVVISGLISSSGTPAQVLAAVDAGRVEIVVSPLLLEELERALAYPKLRRLLGENDVHRALDWLRTTAHVVADPASAPPVRSDDPGDDYLIALAASQRAALVSGDQHLLALEDQIPVYSPRDFLEFLESTR
jgi:putative PIN family toxin of toxin-antitoxin system